MNELVVIAEGETEQTFVRDQLAAHLALYGTTVWAVLPGRHRGQGGVKKWEVARQDIIRILRERRYCSTMFDFYGLPDDWPGRVKSRTLPWNERASHVEQEIHNDIALAMGGSFNPKFFVPYVQLHEFEALAFADVKALTSVIHPLSKETPERLIGSFTEILDTAGHPEAINDNYETCPSRQIAVVVLHTENGHMVLLSRAASEWMYFVNSVTTSLPG
ncbi:MAG: DUF4276 family protein [Candidatus Brocadiaceae bacterium]|nr:DUF4276 family protein [Candidatus Brocadiaceae bacterium]